jgi:hypothetical protein
MSSHFSASQSDSSTDSSADSSRKVATPKSRSISNLEEAKKMSAAHGKENIPAAEIGVIADEDDDDLHVPTTPDP